MSTSMVLSQSTSTIERWTPKNKTAAKKAGEAVLAFLDVATTGFGRATHYNTRLEQQDAELKVHDGLLAVSRDVYAVLLGLDGLTDRARQVAIKKLLSSTRGQDEFISADIEREIIFRLLQDLPPQRMLKLIDALRVGNEELGLKRANNSRTRKLILRTILGNGEKLQLWAVKYRTKLQRALTHAWGKRLTSIIRSILSKPPEARTGKEYEILNRNLIQFAISRFDKGAILDAGREANEKGSAMRAKLDQVVLVALQSVGFILGVRDRLSLPLFKAFEEAKRDLKAGSKLPPEVLEGIRSTYHKGVPKDEILKLTAETMTEGQKVAVQKRAKAAGVQVQADFTSQDPVRLYIFAFENGMTEDVREALRAKAERAAKQFPARFGKLAVIVDTSASMSGDKTQALRPVAAVLAIKDMLVRCADERVVFYPSAGETDPGTEPRLVQPAGDTSLADALVNALCLSPDAVFVLSDGYENTPAGRFAEVVDQVREMGITTPIYHLNPVMAAEAKGIRQLAEGKVPTLPARDPASLGPGMVRGLIEADPVKGINALLRLVLDERKVLTCR